MSSDNLDFFEALETPPSDASTAAAAERCVQYLVFSVARMEVAVALTHVSEIVPHEKVSALPGTPDYVRGIVQLRGRVLPLVDLATKLKREPEPITKRTCILVLELEVSGECWPIGVLTDGVATLLDIEVDKRRPAPKFGEGVDVRFIEYLLPSERGILPALDVQRIFASDELAALARSAEAAAAST